MCACTVCVCICATVTVCVSRCIIILYVRMCVSIQSVYTVCMHMMCAVVIGDSPLLYVIDGSKGLLEVVFLLVH